MLATTDSAQLGESWINLTDVSEGFGAITPDQTAYADRILWNFEAAAVIDFGLSRRTCPEPIWRQRSSRFETPRQIYCILPAQSPKMRVG
jgi:hypothetical protein